MKIRTKIQIRQLVFTAILMAIGLLLFKYLLMEIFGKNILFDASAHIVVASFVLYIFYFFIDQNKSWRIPYFIFAFAVLIIIGIQRILTNAHNDIGLLLGLLIVFVSILIPRWKEIKKKLNF